MCRSLQPARRMVGMAALMGGTMQVPLTAVIFVLELTGDVTALPGPGAAHARRAHERGRLARPAAPSVALADTRAGRRLGPGAAVLLEPAHHVELRAHEVGRLRSRAVILLVEAQHH